MVRAGRTWGQIGTPVLVPGPSLPPLGSGQPRPRSRCRDRAADAEKRYSSAPHSTRRRKKKIYGLCGVETVESILSANGSCPVPSVPALRHGSSQQAARCGHCRTRVHRPCGRYAQSSHFAPSQIFVGLVTLYQRTTAEQQLS